MSRIVSDSGAEGSYVTIRHVIPGKARVYEDHCMRRAENCVEYPYKGQGVIRDEMRER